MSEDGGKKVSEHFRAAEFACRDGSDRILVSEELAALLERLRSALGAPLTVTSGYRTAAYNKKVGGAVKSQHLLGTAADIRAAGVSPRTAARCADALGAGGVGLYEYEGGFTHVDVRAGRVRWLQSEKNGSPVSAASFGTWAGEEKKAAEAVEKQKSEPSDWAREAADWAVKLGIVRGDGTGDCRWREPLTREAFAVLLKRYHELGRNV